MTIEFYAASIKFSGGQELQLENEEIVVFVGANNVGKSTALREIASSLPAGPVSDHKAIASVGWTKRGDNGAFYEWLAKNFVINAMNGQQMVFGYGMAGNQSLSMLLMYWDSAVAGLRNVLTDLSSPCERTTFCSPQTMLVPHEPAPQHPIHQLFMYPSELAKLSDYTMSVFGVSLSMPRAGTQIPIYLGDAPPLESGEVDRADFAYLRRQSTQTKLHEQGDGMRSFVAALLRLRFSPQLVHLLDEPEGFLHPPQARQLGKYIVTEKRPATQVFMSTHSADIVRGVCDAKPKRVSIVRLERKGDKTLAHGVDAAKLSALWEDPLLDFSNVLDGLFHEAVIVCEGDADCRFYQAILRAVQIAKGERQSDTLFVSSGGKQNAPKIVRALRAAGVAVKVALDFDVLNDASVIASLLDAYGVSDPKPFLEARLRIEKSLVKEPPLTAPLARERVAKILDGLEGELDDWVARELAKAVKRPSIWDAPKLSGEGAFPGGDASRTVKELLKMLADVGVHVVPVGEMERFCKSIPGKASPWVSEVLTTYTPTATHDELREARAFVDRLTRSPA